MILRDGEAWMVYKFGCFFQAAIQAPTEFYSFWGDSNASLDNEQYALQGAQLFSTASAGAEWTTVTRSMMKGSAYGVPLTDNVLVIQHDFAGYQGQEGAVVKEVLVATGDPYPAYPMAPRNHSFSRILIDPLTLIAGDNLSFKMFLTFKDTV